MNLLMLLFLYQQTLTSKQKWKTMTLHLKLLIITLWRIVLITEFLLPPEISTKPLIKLKIFLFLYKKVLEIVLLMMKTQSLIQFQIQNVVNNKEVWKTTTTTIQLMNMELLFKLLENVLISLENSITMLQILFKSKKLKIT